MPKGFGKNYFTLAAIQACNATTQLMQMHVRIEMRHLLRPMQPECDSEEEEPQADFLPRLAYSAAHCNCHYRRRARHVIKTRNAILDYRKRIIVLNPSTAPPKNTLHNKHFKHNRLLKEYH